MNDEQLIQLFTKQAEAQGKKIDTKKIALMLKQNRNGYRNNFMNMVLSNEAKNQPAVDPGATAKAAISNQQNAKMQQAVEAVNPVDPLTKVAQWKAKWALNNQDLYKRMEETDKMIAAHKSSQSINPTNTQDLLANSRKIQDYAKSVQSGVDSKDISLGLKNQQILNYAKGVQESNPINSTNFSADNTNAVNETVNTTQESPSNLPNDMYVDENGKTKIKRESAVNPGVLFGNPFAWIRGLRQKYGNQVIGNTKIFKDGGKITPEEMFAGYLFQLSGATNEQELQQWITAQGEEQMKQHYLDFVQLMQQGQKTPAMKNGSKLNYIKQLKGVCPEGYEVEYFEQGGSMIKKCKKCENGALPYRPMKGEKGTELVQQFKKERKEKQTSKSDSTYTKEQYDKDVKDFQNNGYKFKDKAHQDRVQNWNRKNPTELEKHACGGKKKLAKRK